MGDKAKEVGLRMKSMAKSQIPHFPPQFAPAPVPKAAAAPVTPTPSEITACFTPPAGIVKAVENAGVAKTKMPIHKVFMLAILAGAYIGIGAAASVSFGRGLSNYDPGVAKFCGAAVFPIGLILVILCGAELVTGNFSVLIPGLLNGTVKWYQLLGNWVTVWLGNFVGSLACAYFFAYLTDLYVKDPYLAGVHGIAEAKTSLPWGAVVCSGAGCNWLVCLSVWMAIGAKTVIGKVAVIWWPIMIFVMIGYEHCVANMFLIPLGMMYGANVTFGECLGHNIIPATIGNIIGGGICVGTYYWYLYGISPAPPKAKEESDSEEEEEEEEEDKKEKIAP